MISKGTVVSTVEEVTLIDQKDILWKEVQICSKEILKSSKRRRGSSDEMVRLRPVLSVDEGCTTEERVILKHLLTKHQVFASSDSELGETDLVKH